MARSGRLFSKTHVTRRASVAWLAVFVLFAQALMPLTQAWAHDAQTDGELQVICTANGVQTITLGLDGEPIEAVDTVSCPFCTIHTVTGIFTPHTTAISTVVAPIGLNIVQPTTFTPSSIWRGSPRPSRAPPLSV